MHTNTTNNVRTSHSASLLGDAGLVLVHHILNCANVRA